LTCICLRKVYYGFGCSHIFAAMLENGIEIGIKLDDLIKDRWKIDSSSVTHNPTQTLAQTSFTQFKFFQTPQKKKKNSQGVRNKDFQNENFSEILSRKERECQSGSESEESPLLSRNKKPNPPIKPPSAYFLYQKDVKEEFQKKYPSYRWVDLVKTIAVTYRNLSPSKKKKYENLSAELKLDYEHTLKYYNQNFGVRSSQKKWKGYQTNKLFVNIVYKLNFVNILPTSYLLNIH